MSGTVSAGDLARWQEIQNDIDQVEEYIKTRKYGPIGTLAMMRLRQILRLNAFQLEQGGIYARHAPAANA